MTSFRALVVLFLSAAAFTFVPSSSLRAQRAAADATSGGDEPRHVILVSIDGLMPSVYTKPGPSKMPTLRRLAQEGAYADGVIGVIPTVTYPSHTTMITGVLPAVHGIYTNTILDPEGTSNGEWNRFARDIKVSTLPGVVKGRGLSTAAVFWPVSIGMDVDYLVPEILYYTHPKMIDLARAVSHPKHLFDAIGDARGRPLPWPMRDSDRTDIASWIFRTYRPHLLLLHIFDTDTAQHSFGPGSPEALAAIEQADAHIQQLIDAVAATGLQSRTDIVVVSDHGFLALEQLLQPNALFKQEGLIEVDPATNRIRKWDAYFQANGGSGYVWLKNPDDGALRGRVEALLKKVASDPANGVQTVWDREAIRKAGGDARASFWVDVKNGFYTGAGHDVLVKKSTSKGGHGFAPTRPELHASLIMRGPDVPKAGSLGVVRMTQIAPTIASWFGVSLSPRVDAPLPLPTSRASSPASSTPASR